MGKGWADFYPPFADENPLVSYDTRYWQAAAAERRWLYLQMDQALREALVPMFCYFELDNLVLCLRFLEANHSSGIASILSESLLSRRLKRMIELLYTGKDFVGRVENFLRDTTFEVKGLVEAYREGGVRLGEEFLRRRFFEQVLAACSHPAMTDFFRRIIDIQNTMIMAKCLRWKIREEPGFIAGGYVVMRGVLRKPSEEGVATIVRRTAQGTVVGGEELQPVRLQPLLQAHLTRTLTRKMHSGDPVACCVGYVWNCYVSMRRLSGEFHEVTFTEHFESQRESWQ